MTSFLCVPQWDRKLWAQWARSVPAGPRLAFWMAPGEVLVLPILPNLYFYLVLYWISWMSTSLSNVAVVSYNRLQRRPTPKMLMWWVFRFFYSTTPRTHLFQPLNVTILKFTIYFWNEYGVYCIVFNLYFQIDG